MKNKRTIGIWLSFIIIFFLTSCSDADVAPTVEEEPAVETLTGNYTGGWTSTTQTTSFTNYLISAKLTADPQQRFLSGGFFATPNFTTCCNSGANDGSISIVLAGDSITSFSLSVIIPDCGGFFRGTGVVSATGNLVIDITGNDCDGDHVGQLVFRK
jgi:hypothetical protein